MGHYSGKDDGWLEQGTMPHRSGMDEASIQERCRKNVFIGKG
jgi:hypothetical protein